MWGSPAIAGGSKDCGSCLREGKILISKRGGIFFYVFPFLILSFVKQQAMITLQEMAVFNSLFVCYVMICNAVSTKKLLVAQYGQPSKTFKGQRWAITNKYLKKLK